MHKDYLITADGTTVTDTSPQSITNALPSTSSDWFVKPARGGSSIGITHVTAPEQMQAAIQAAQQYDDTVLVETAIRGREIEVAVLGNAAEYQVSDLGEIIADGQFYDYESKYSDAESFGTTVDVAIDDELRHKVREYAGIVYRNLQCSGLARVDFLVDEKNRTVYLNEVNTMPGFTNISMYPKLWMRQGWSYSQLVDRLLQLGLSASRGN